ncbi:MAG: hypothetical protein NUV78_00425 [Candidatus Zambryskibacteria bacterium]|nr:hypothetical protein [Candidatus Zambryskibacteria bacterium]
MKERVMKGIQAYSIELNRKGAQVIVMLGDRPVTRHAVRTPSGLMGFNPDETARGRRLSANMALAEAQSGFNTLKEKLKVLPKDVEQADRRKLERALQRAGSELKAAKLHQEKTLEEYPEKVIFV